MLRNEKPRVALPALSEQKPGRMTGAKGRGGPSHAGPPDGGYRREYHRSYRSQEHESGMADVPRKYEHSPKYDGGDKYERGSGGPDRAPAGATGGNAGGGGFRGHGSGAGAGGGDGGGGAQAAALASLDKRITSVQQDLNQALQDVTSKENEKFDLIFSILVELQKRQAQLEESVRTVKAQLCPGGMEQQQPGGQQHGGHQQRGGQQPHQHQGQQQQLGGPMGQAMGGYMGGQVPMNQQYASLAAGDGSPAYFAPVVVAMPPGGAQLPYAVPQLLPPAGAMQAMPQQMAIQFMGQGQGEDYHWGGGCCGGGGAAAESTAASSGSQPAGASRGLL